MITYIEDDIKQNVQDFLHMEEVTDLLHVDEGLKAYT